MVRIGSWANLVLVLVGLALMQAATDLARGYMVSYFAGAPNTVIAYEATLMVIISSACFVYPVLKG